MAAAGERYLLPAERRVVSVRRHPALLGRPAAAALLALVVAGTVTGRMVHGAFGRLVWLAAVVVVARLVWRILEWNVDRFIVTDQRILVVRGLVTRRVMMLPLRKVTDMTYERSPAGRMLGYGEFVMESAGESQGMRRVAYLPSPDVLYLQISDLLFGPNGVRPSPDDYF